MSEKTQIILLAIGLIVNTIVCFEMLSRIDQLEQNQEIMRKYINQRFKEIEKNENRNTNEVTKLE